MFAFLAAGLLCADEPEVWYIHGWDGLYSGERSCKSQLTLLKAIFPSAEVSKEKWDANAQFSVCAERADKLADSLAEKIAALPAKRRKALILVGHSLGGRIVIRTAARLSEKKIVIRRVIALAAAIPIDDSDCETAFRQQSIPCINVFCSKDSALKKVYGLVGEKKSVVALGMSGYPTISAFHRQYRKKQDAHDADEYLSCLQERIGTPSDPPVQLDVAGIHPPVREVIVPKVIEEYKDWKLGKPFRPGEYWIVDPAGYLRESGSEGEMRKIFERIKRQLDRK